VSAHRYFATLSDRDVSEANKYTSNFASEPEKFGMVHLGSVYLSYVAYAELLLVLFDEVDKEIIYAEFSNDSCGACDEATDLHSWQSRHQGIYGVANSFYKIDDADDIERLCHFVMGWRPDCHDYNKTQREDICTEIRKCADRLKGVRA